MNKICTAKKPRVEGLKSSEILADALFIKTLRVRTNNVKSGKAARNREDK